MSSVLRRTSPVSRLELFEQMKGVDTSSVTHSLEGFGRWVSVCDVIDRGRLDEVELGARDDEVEARQLKRPAATIDERDLLSLVSTFFIDKDIGKRFRVTDTGDSVRVPSICIAFGGMSVWSVVE